jgi:hypothetical protein
MAQREHVYGVVEYYNGVLDGVADFAGRPRAFVLNHDDDTPAPM